MARDIKLKQDSNSCWDIDFLNGDFELTDGLDTALYLSVFGEKRASRSEVTEPTLRRGHFTNEFSAIQDYEVGSKLWLFIDQAKNTESNLLSIENTVSEGLSWMIDDNIISDSEVEAQRVDGGVEININLTNQTQEDSNYYNLFINTFR